MAEDEKVVEEKKTEEIKSGEKKEEIKETQKELEEKPQFDSSAIEEIREKMAEFEKKSEEDKSKLEKAKKALLGEDESTKEDEEFYKKLATMPKEAVEDLIKKNIEPINKKFQEQAILERDRITFTNLRNMYPDFDEVIRDASSYLTKEEIGETEGLSNRTEIRFNLIRGRREMDLRNKKTKEVNVMNKAKEEINKTAITEVPRGGGTMETKEVEDELDEDIKSNIREGKWNKGEGFTKHDEKIFEKFQRDVYGIRRK